MRRSLMAFAVFALAACTGLWAQSPKLVATTAWTAAFVRSAGFTGPIRILAPVELEHPPEYELRPSDIPAVLDADVVVYAGYERMMSRILDAAKGSKVKLVQIVTDQSLATIRKSVWAIAELLGTGTEAERNLAAIEAFYASWRQEIAGWGLQGAAVLGHAMHLPLLGELGFKVAGVFGPAPLEAARIRDLSGLGSSLIADNAHAPVGTPLKETLSGARYVELINFPSREGSVVDILSEDRRRLLEAWGTGR